MRTTPVSSVALIAFAILLDASEKRVFAEDKPPVSLSVFTRTWPNGYSEIRWTEDEKQHRVVTNIDCSKLPLALTFDSMGEKFDLFTVASSVGADEVAALQTAGAADANGFPVEWPKQNRPTLGGPAQYLLGWDGSFSTADVQKATIWLDALHRYFDAHRAEILAAWQERERQKPLREAAAKALELRLHQEALLPPTQIRVISVEARPPEADPARQTKVQQPASKK